MAKRVFFSFHYQDVIDFRANVIRNHWLTKKDRKDAGFFDASIWEDAKEKGVQALKDLIDSEVMNTSVTAVLIGSGTYERRWVRYEIMASFVKGNDLVGIHINRFKDKYGKTKAKGRNPFECLGILHSEDGSEISFWELRDGKWVSYRDLSGYKLKHPRPRAMWGTFKKLSDSYSVYDWEADDGYENFAGWVA